MKNKKLFVVLLVCLLSFSFNSVHATSVIDYDAITIDMSTISNGLYNGSAMGKDGNIKVYVRVKDNKIINVNISSTREHEFESEIKDALTIIPQRIVDQNKVEVSLVPSAKATSRGIINAVKDALVEVKTVDGEQVVVQEEPLAGEELMPKWKRQKELRSGTLNYDLRVSSVEKTSIYAVENDTIEVTFDGETITVGGEIPYYEDSYGHILGHDLGVWLYELKINFANIDSTTAAFKVVGTNTNTYDALGHAVTTDSDGNILSEWDAGAPWMDGDYFVYHIVSIDSADANGEASSTFIVDNDGDWTTTDDQVSYSIAVASDATFEPAPII